MAASAQATSVPPTTAVAAQPAATQVPANSATPLTAASASTDFPQAIRSVAQQVKPAVVQVTNEQVIQLRQFSDPLQVPAGVGSGVIYDNQGHILTNNHVIEGAQQIQVSLPDQRSFPATIVGADPQTDLAVIQIQGDNLPVAQLGDSSQLQVGDWVVAIGNALGLPGGPTVTQGVVSALGRTVQEPADQPSSPAGQGAPGGGRGGLGGGQAAPGGGRGGIGGGGGGGGGGGIGGIGGGGGGAPGAPAPSAGPFLFDAVQTDAPINPGNSGGPLVNLAGQVIGIDTLVAGEAEPGVQAQGIGFAISINTAKPIADQLVQNGKVVHPFLGIEYVPLNPAISVRMQLPPATSGVIVANVQPGSPAATAGLQQQDVITAIDGQPLTGDSSLAEDLNAHKPGDSVTLTVLRSGQNQQVPVALGQMPTTATSQPPQN